MAVADAGVADHLALHAQRVAGARELAPRLRERAAETDAARHVPRESIDEILAAGLGGRMLTPARFGGDELTLDTMFDVAVELGKGCSSTSWCATLLPHGCHIMGMFPEAAQQAVWADGPDPTIATSLPPTAKVRKVPGGYRLTGEHHFASGVDHATWVVVSGMVPGDDRPVNHQFLVKAGDFTIRDTWFAAGMRGTGSKTIVIDDVFVPEGFELVAERVITGDGPGAELNRNPLYRVPLAIHGGLTFIGPIVGAARGTYEYFVEWTRERRTERGAKVAESEVVYEAIALAAADIDAAELLVRRTLEVARRADPPGPDERATTLRDYSRAVGLLTGAVDRLFKQSGTRAFMESSPLQRMWRDVHMMASHIAFTRDNLNHFSRLALGLDRDPRMLIH